MAYLVPGQALSRSVVHKMDVGVRRRSTGGKGRVIFQIYRRDLFGVSFGLLRTSAAVDEYPQFIWHQLVRQLDCYQTGRKIIIKKKTKKLKIFRKLKNKKSLKKNQ